MIADFGVKTNADLTLISQLRGRAKLDLLEAHKTNHTTTAVSVDRNTRVKNTIRGEGKFAVHSNPNWTVTPIFAFAFCNFLTDIHLYYNFSAVGYLSNIRE